MRFLCWRFYNFIFPGSSARNAFSAVSTIKLKCKFHFNRFPEVTFCSCSLLRTGCHKSILVLEFHHRINCAGPQNSKMSEGFPSLNSRGRQFPFAVKSVSPDVLSTFQIQLVYPIMYYHVLSQTFTFFSASVMSL